MNRNVAEYFSWRKSITIDWKDGQNLCERMPRQAQAQAEGGEADDLENGFEGDPGSFFWYFQEKADFFNASFFFFICCCCGLTCG